MDKINIQKEQNELTALTLEIAERLCIKHEEVRQYKQWECRDLITPYKAQIKELSERISSLEKQKECLIAQIQN